MRGTALELREDEDTVYVTEPDILYAEEEEMCIRDRDRTGGVAAGVGYQSGLLRDLVTIDLAESV